MVLATQAFRHQLTLAGRPMRLRYYSETIGSVWDDERTVVASGADLYVSGLIVGINSTEGSDDRILLEEGRITFNDTKFMIAGSIDTTSGAKNFTLSISGLDKVYRSITPGFHRPEFFGEINYQVIYGRLIPNGSLF